eukprot:7220595-Prymnesium_polylepis.1
MLLLVRRGGCGTRSHSVRGWAASREPPCVQFAECGAHPTRAQRFVPFDRMDCRAFAAFSAAEDVAQTSCKFCIIVVAGVGVT